MIRTVGRGVAAAFVTFCLITAFPVIDYLFSQKTRATEKIHANIRLESIAFKKKSDPPPKKRVRSLAKTQRPTSSKLTTSSSRFNMEFGSGDGVGASIAKGKIEGVIYKEGEVDKDAVLRSSTLPKYPEGAQSAGISGYVVLVVVIDERGDVIDITVEESTQGYGFKEVCIESVQQWKFTPATLKGVPVKMQYRIPFRF